MVGERGEGEKKFVIWWVPLTAEALPDPGGEPLGRVRDIILSKGIEVVVDRRVRRASFKIDPDNIRHDAAKDANYGYLRELGIWVSEPAPQLKTPMGEQLKLGGPFSRVPKRK